MAKISIKSPETTPSVVTRDYVQGYEQLEKLSIGDLDSTITTYFVGGPDTPQLFELFVEPNGELSPHGHEFGEILYILEGEMHLGGRVLHPKTAIYIPALTAYLIKAGPKGLRFLNFTGRGDGAYVHRDDLVAMRGATDTVAAAHLIED